MLKITMIIVMTFFTIILTPHERASANPLAVGGALYLGGAGVYVLGAVGIAAIYGLAGCDSCEDDINAHASRTWDGTTQLAKDGMQAMVDASVGLGSALSSTDAGFNTWMDSNIDAFASGLSKIQLAMTSNIQATAVPNVDNRPYFDGGAFLAFNASSTGFLVANGMSVTHIEIYMHKDAVWIGYKLNATATQVYKNLTMTAAEISAFQSLMRASNTQDQMAGLFAKLGYSLLVLKSQVAVDAYMQGVSTTREAWQDMRDAGLVLPTDTARLVNEYGPVTYDPATDSYAGIDGVNVARGDISVEYQKPHWKTLEDLALAGLSGAAAGLYIDGWAGSDSITSTYDPVTDMTTTTTTTTGATSTNVTTGETVTSTSATTTTTTATGDTTGETSSTPEGETPKTQTGKANRWGKLVTTKFPFSLPWDLFFILSFLNADPKTPVFSIDERINKRPNVEGIAIKFDIDLSFLDPYVPWFRRFIVLGFALFLILNTRKLLGGAQ